MYRLLLLDDEEIVTRGIQKVFDLQGFGFQVVGAFSNPLKALEQVGELKPDLIITDVKMPQMDGLEFSGQVKQILPDVEIVILSGYGDFSYAQTAVKLGVSDYLLKPIKKDDFKKMLEQMHHKIESKQSQKDYYQSLQKMIQNGYTELKNHFFLALAENGEYDENLYQVLKEHLENDITDVFFMLIKIDIYRMSTVGDYMSEIGKLTQQMEEILSDYGKVEDFQSDESLYFFLYDIQPEEKEQIKNAVYAVVDEKRRKEMHLSIGISQIHQGLKEMFSARNDCINQIFMVDANIDEASESNPVREHDMNVNIPYAELEILFHSISMGEMYNIKDMLEKVYAVPDHNLHILYRDYSFSITFLILLRIYQIQGKYDVDSVIVEPELLDMKNLKKDYPTLEKQKELVENRIRRISDFIAEQKVAAPSKMVQSALDYINAHFCENISLQDVADNINISKNYLCDIFKKELGVSFINYVTNLRMEKAKEYLAKPDMKMYEVSNAVGYNDYAYFSQIFKKNTGMTLSEYRKKI